MIQVTVAGETAMVTSNKSGAGADFTVMSVDASERVHEAVENIARESGHPLRVIARASSPSEAIELAARLQPDIVVLDIQLQSPGGAVLGRQLQGLLDRQPLLICLTGAQRFDRARLAVQLGAVDLLPKPVTREDLAQALQKAVATLRSMRHHEQERMAMERRLGQAIQTPSAPARPHRTRSSQIAQAVRRYVEAHYAENISLQSAADYVRLSASYLGPLFKAVCGLSFRTYLRIVRIARAKDLMRDPALNLSEIAQRVGFEDENYFSQVFLEVTGMRPGQYRNSSLGQQ